MALSAASEGGDLARRLYQDGQKAQSAGDTMHAYLLYSRAAALEPLNVRFMASRDALAAKAALSAGESIALSPLEGAAPEISADELANFGLSPSEMSGGRPALPPPQLKASPVRKAFDLRGAPQSVIEQVAAAYGIQVVFDSAYQPPPAFVFRTGEMGMEEALRTLEEVSNSLLFPVNESLVLVARDSPQRRTESTPEMSLAIPIPERVSVQDAQEILTAVQQTLEIRRMVVDPGRHTVFLRDTVSKATAARQLFTDLSRLRAQVEVEIELLSVNRHSSLSIGLNLQNASGIFPLGNFLNSTPSVGTFANLLTFGGGKTLFGLGIADAQAFATLARSSTQSVLRSEIVTLDGLPGSLHVGDHYPLISNGYYGQASGTGTVYTPPPTINFVDLGLVIKVTPSVHEGGEITLDIDAQFSVLGTQGSNDIPSISQRKYTGKVRLGKGEWGVIAGLATESHSVAANGIPVLASIPILGRLFRSDTIADDDIQILLVLKPRVVDLPPWDLPVRTLWVGTEGKPLSLY